MQYLPDRPQPVPMADLPLEYRVENWVGVNSLGRGGSCMWASLWNCVRGANRPDLEQLLESRKNTGFEGPETLPGLARKLASIGIPWAATEDGDVELLKAATISNRWAVVGYYTGHAVNFCGFATLNPRARIALADYAARNKLGLRYRASNSTADRVAILLDNNDPRSYIVVEPRERFVDNWRKKYAGIGLVPWLDRFVPRTYPRTRSV